MSLTESHFQDQLQLKWEKLLWSRLALELSRHVCFLHCCSDGLISDLRHYVKFSKVLKCKFGDATWPILRHLENPSVNRAERKKL